MLSTIEVHIQQNHEEVQRVQRQLLGVMEVLGIQEPPPRPVQGKSNTGSLRFMVMDEQICLTSEMLEACQMLVSIIHQAMTSDPREVAPTQGGISREMMPYWQNKVSPDMGAYEDSPARRRGPYPEDRTLKSSLDPRRPGGTMDY